MSADRTDEVPAAPSEAGAHEAFDDARPRALVCAEGELLATVKSALEQLGYVIHVPENAQNALNRIRKNIYPVVVVDEEYQGASPLDNPVLQGIRAMPMSIRRYMLVALVGKKLATFDHMMAFSKSVNVVVNLYDLPQLPAILKRAVADNEEFYRVFTEVLQAAGKR